MADNFWLSDEPWAAIAPHLPMVHTGPERKDDRRVISGIVHRLGFVTLPGRRARSVSASWMVRPLRLQSATWSSRPREVRGAFGRR